MSKFVKYETKNPPRGSAAGAKDIVREKREGKNWIYHQIVILPLSSIFLPFLTYGVCFVHLIPLMFVYVLLHTYIPKQIKSQHWIEIMWIKINAFLNFENVKNHIFLTNICVLHKDEYIGYLKWAQA